jgi:hypothetical protein
VKFAADLTLESRIDELVLADAGQAGEGGRNDARTVMVTIPGQIIDGDLGVGKGFRQMGVERFDGHGHAGVSWVIRDENDR